MWQVEPSQLPIVGLKTSENNRESMSCSSEPDSFRNKNKPEPQERFILSTTYLARYIVVKAPSGSRFDNGSMQRMYTQTLSSLDNVFASS